MCVRALKEEFTHVKMLYLAMYSILLSGTALIVLPAEHNLPTPYQLTLLLSCGAACGHRLAVLHDLCSALHIPHAVWH